MCDLQVEVEVVRTPWVAKAADTIHHGAAEHGRRRRYDVPIEAKQRKVDVRLLRRWRYGPGNGLLVERHFFVRTHRESSLRMSLQRNDPSLERRRKEMVICVQEHEVLSPTMCDAGIAAIAAPAWSWRSVLSAQGGACDVRHGTVIEPSFTRMTCNQGDVWADTLCSVSWSNRACSVVTSRQGMMIEASSRTVGAAIRTSKLLELSAVHQPGSRRNVRVSTNAHQSPAGINDIVLKGVELFAGRHAALRTKSEAGGDAPWQAARKQSWNEALVQTGGGIPTKVSPAPVVSTGLIGSAAAISRVPSG